MFSSVEIIVLLAMPTLVVSGHVLSRVSTPRWAFTGRILRAIGLGLILGTVLIGSFG